MDTFSSSPYYHTNALSNYMKDCFKKPKRTHTFVDDRSEPGPLQRERADCPAIQGIAADSERYDNVFPSTQSEP